MRCRGDGGRRREASSRSRTRTEQGTPGIDVRAGLVRQLMGLGVTNIEADPRCTIEDESFFSYRREGTTGRQAGLVWLP